MLNYYFCDYSEAYVIFKGQITRTATNIITFKNHTYLLVVYER